MPNYTTWTALISSNLRTVTLSLQDSYLSKMTYKPGKLGQNDLVVGL